MMINGGDRYINFFVNSTGTNPIVSGTNSISTTADVLNVATALEQNKEFFAAEAVAYMQTTYSAYNFDSELCKRDVRRYIDALKYDTLFTGNYKSVLAARYY